jgi:hypothetical protein
LSEVNEEIESVVTEPELLMSGTQPVRLSADIVGTTLVAEVVEKTAEDEVIPNTIAGYQIERLIGRGGCGRVLLGRDPETGSSRGFKADSRAGAE